MVAATDQSAVELLSADEAPAFELVEVASPAPIVLACDHAGNRIPAVLGNLGLAPEQLEQHIAWDIGAGAVARILSERLHANAILGNYSRLVVDLNRDLEDSTAFPAISDGILVPGNLSLDRQRRAQRARALFKPYHEALARLTARLSTDARVPVIVSIHTFTPKLYGVRRPWHIGVLWDKDPRLALPLIAALRRREGVLVGDNEPYSGKHPADFTVDHHAEAAGLAHAGIEIRQDLVNDVSGQRRWAALVGDALESVLTDPRLFSPMQRAASRT